MMRGFRIVLLGMAVLLSMTAATDLLAATRKVPSQYATIQAAINAAVKGDVVVVAQGMYQENINFNGKAITVRGTNPTNKTVVAATIIDGRQCTSVVTFESGEKSTSVLQGLTVTNGRAYGGGGVSCSKASSPTIANNLIRGNQATSNGGGVRCEGSSPVLTGNTISDNSAVQGGGVACDNDSSPVLTSNTIRGNTASLGGGLFCSFSSSPRIANNIVSGNSATSPFYGCGGGALFCTHSASPTLVNNTISGNSGGGVHIENGSSPIFRNTIIAFSTGGAGLYVGDPFEGAPIPVVTYCNFYNNSGGNYFNWPNQTGKRGNISKNPLFADAARNDFHLKSKGGRWNPKTKAWVQDLYHSACIDAGGPTYAFGQEPAPNGGRINMGAYGNTKRASKSAPAAPSGALLVTAAAHCAAGGVTQITVNLSAAASVQVSLCNIAGREVAVLPEQELQPGVSTLLWNGQSRSGTRAPAGQYLVKLIARGQDGGQSQALAGFSLGL